LKKADILINRCTILPMNGEDSIREGTLAIKDDKIVFVDKSNSAMSIDADHRIDAKGKVAVPDFVNCQRALARQH
jgi:cytosine/adenosine deaminase-related metal-dependent hydrolase